MNLSQQCRKLISGNCKQLAPEHPLGPRLVSLEYSKSIDEVKPYPLLSTKYIFFLCWYFNPNSHLCATMCPAPEKFCYNFFFENNSITQLHTHEYIELGYVVKGNFKQRISNKDVIFHEGDFCLIDKNCIHQDYLLDQEAIVIFFGIENSMFEEALDENVTTNKINSFLQTSLTKQKDLQQFIHFRPMPGAKEKMEACISSLISELYENEIGSHYICRGLLLRIFRLLSTSYEFSLTKKQKNEMKWILFEEICEYIQSHYQDITIEELETAFHFQKDYFNRLIKKNTGLTYSEYLQSIRLNEAKKLLLQTDLSISEIAEQIGYHNKGYFYKIFTQKYSMTPAEYRQKQI